MHDTRTGPVQNGLSGKKPGSLKRNNRKAILSLFRFSDRLSISEVSARVHLSKTTVIKIIADLQKQRLIVPAGKGISTDEGGKKPLTFAFNAGYRYILSLGIGHDRIRGMTFDLRANACGNQLFEVAVDPMAPFEETVRGMVQLIGDLMKDSSLKASQICGIVVGSPGIVDVTQGTVRRRGHPAWNREVPLKSALEEALPFRTAVVLNNECRFAGFAELLDQGNTAYNRIVTILVKEAAGGCVMENQRLVQGAHGFVGEFGHVIVDPGSAERCSCGGKGCVESLVSNDAILREAYRKVPEYPNSSLREVIETRTLTAPGLLEAAGRGDPLGREIIDRVIGHFEMLIHNLAMVYDPQRIIFQGTYASAGEYFFETLRSRVISGLFFNPAGGLSIVPSRIDPDEAFLKGAAYYVSSRYLESEGLHD